jgi:hypothetical protein
MAAHMRSAAQFNQTAVYCTRYTLRVTLQSDRIDERRLMYTQMGLDGTKLLNLPSSARRAWSASSRTQLVCSQRLRSEQSGGQFLV